MSHTLIQSSDRAACSCGHWWTKVYTIDSPEVAALHQRHAEAWAVTV